MAELDDGMAVIAGPATETGELAVPLPAAELISTSSGTGLHILSQHALCSSSSNLPVFAGLPSNRRS